MSSAGREPTLPTGAPDMVVCGPGRSHSGDVRPRPLTPPNARFVNATLAHEDNASLRWIATTQSSKAYCGTVFR